MFISRRSALLALALSSMAPVLSARETLSPASDRQSNADATNPGGFNMKTRTVELQNGILMPIYGIGTYSLHGDRCISSVLEALKNGVRLIDTAHIYGNEREVGEAVRRSGIPLNEIFVITKLYPNQYSDPKAAIDESLERLNIGTVDMVLLHHPGSDDVKAYHALEEAVKAGRIRAIGLSNWYEKELKDFLQRVSIKPALVQNEIHPYYQEQDVVPFIQKLGITVQARYPLGGRGYTEALLSDPVLNEIGRAHGKSAAQVILRWDLQRGVVVIPGSSNPAHIRENTEIFDFELSVEEMNRIAKLDRAEKHDWY